VPPPRRHDRIIEVRVSHLFLVVTLIGAAGASCAKARPHTEPVIPELVPPLPPPRIVERIPSDPVPTIEPSPVESALASLPARPTPKPEPPKPEPPKPEPARPEPEKPVSAAPPLTLKPAPGVAAQTLASIRSLLESAQRNLQRVNYAALDADGRAQFDTARGFMLQADEAIKANNLAFAGKLADKAATMAAVLVR
jgi:hypothetical protein